MENRIVNHPGAWKAADIAGHYDNAFRFEARHLDALDRALAGVREQGLALDHITAESFPLDALADDLSALYREVMEDAVPWWRRQIAFSGARIGGWLGIGVP